jgi:hypothetical protein
MRGIQNVLRDWAANYLEFYDNVYPVPRYRFYVTFGESGVNAPSTKSASDGIFAFSFLGVCVPTGVASIRFAIGDGPVLPEPWVGFTECVADPAVEWRDGFVLFRKNGVPSWTWPVNTLGWGSAWLGDQQVWSSEGRQVMIDGTQIDGRNRGLCREIHRQRPKGIQHFQQAKHFVMTGFPSRTG